MAENGNGPDKASLGAAQLRAEPSRECPEGGGHKLRQAVVDAARERGEASGVCEACGENVRLVRA